MVLGNIVKAIAANTNNIGHITSVIDKMNDNMLKLVGLSVSASWERL
jgi:hypothetical protein